MRARTAPSPLRTTVASTVRAELARAGVSQSTAAAWIGVTQPAMSARLHAHVPFTVDEIAAIAEGLGVPLVALLEAPAHAGMPFQGGGMTKAGPLPEGNGPAVVAGAGFEPATSGLRVAADDCELADWVAQVEMWANSAEVNS